MQGSNSPLSIGTTLSATVTTEPGRTVTVPLHVYDHGSDALTITGKIVYVTIKAKTEPVPASWHARLTPSALTLQPGGSASVTLTFRVPPGSVGLEHVLNYEFAGQAVGGTGSVKLSGAVAGTLTVHTPQAAPPPASTPTYVVVFGLVLLACLLTVAFLLVRRVIRLVRSLRRRRAHQHAPAPEQNARVPR